MSTEVITSSDIYWLTRLDALSSVLGGFAIGFLILATICLMAFGMASIEGLKEENAGALRWFKGSLIVGAFSVVGWALVPSTREAIAIVVVPKIANNEDVQGLGADTVKVAREWLEELRPASAKAK